MPGSEHVAHRKVRGRELSFHHRVDEVVAEGVGGATITLDELLALVTRWQRQEMPGSTPLRFTERLEGEEARLRIEARWTVDRDVT